MDTGAEGMTMGLEPSRAEVNGCCLPILAFVIRGPSAAHVARQCVQG